jgi:hypothetical protein
MLLTLTDLQVEMHARAGVEATGIRLTRDEFEELKYMRGRPRDPLIQDERGGRPATVMGLPVTWVERPVTPKLLPPLKRARTDRRR